ncbi:Ribokinase-like protein [Mycena haematopus]|nr:Ribokinase-like protein [Mycena haematopus]
MIPPVPGRPLRIVASGTLFLTHTLSLPTHPAPSTVVRAQSVTRTRGGSASTLLSLLAQFSRVEAFLVAPLGGNDEGKMILRDLEREGVTTRYCKLWKGLGVPSAWVLESADTNTRTVVNHNPLPDITHEEFVTMLGPLLAPENYMFPPSPAPSPTLTSVATPSPARSPGPQPNPNSPAPFDWLHFEGRSVKTTLSNITGLDGLARERKWRSHCIFSVDVGRSKGRQGVEALIPHADVLFLNKHYAQATSPSFATSPRAFLLSLTAIAPPHALLVAHWGSEGAAVLSLPTKEYFQSSGWVEERPKMPPTPTRGRNDHKADAGGSGESAGDLLSVRSGSEFWAGRQSGSASSSAFTASQYMMSEGNTNTRRSSPSYGRSRSHGEQTQGHNRSRNGSTEDEDDNDSQGTEIPEEDEADVVDEVGAQDAFVAGMIYALSRRITPGPPYTPSSGGDDTGATSRDSDKGRWRLDECLRFATELSGRKARRRTWDGLGAEMTRAGWFDTSA